MRDRLTQLGAVVDDDDIQLFALEGLPADYDAVKMAVTMGKDYAIVLPWQELKDALEDFAESPGVCTRGAKYV